MDVIKTIELLKNTAKGTLIGGMSLLALSVFFFFYFGISRDWKERKKSCRKIIFLYRNGKRG